MKALIGRSKAQLPFEGLGNALRLIRLTRNLTQSQVASTAGISQGMLSSYENDRVLPEVATLQKVLVALQADLRDLSRAVDTVQAEQRQIECDPSARSRSGELALREMLDRAVRLGAISEEAIAKIAVTYQTPAK